MAVNFNHINNTITAVSGRGLLVDIGSGAATYQLFNSSSTWTKPSGAVGVYVECVGGGGGGGGPAFILIASGVSQYADGGNGGLGGGFVSRSFVATTISSSVTITVGAGGAGGGHRNPDSTSTTGGFDGSDGGVSSFGAYITTHPGRGGVGAITASAVNLATGPAQGSYRYGNLGIFTSGLYSNGNGSNLVGSPTTRRGGIAALGPGNGGPGGGVESTTGAFGPSYAGLDGGLGFAEQRADISNSILGGTAFSVGGGQNGGESLGGTPGSGETFGCGGGGGSAFWTSGGNGGYPGGGGGGAGSAMEFSTGIVTMGSGGTGGNGYVLVVTW